MNHWLKGTLVVLTLASAGVLSACNTVEGAGKDIERAGEKVQDASCREGDASCRK